MKNGILQTRMIKRVEISHKTIIFTALFLIFLWLLYSIKEILLGLFVALLVMAILNPLVTRLIKFRIPRALAVSLAYLLVFGILGVALASIVTPLIEETANFANGLPNYLENIGVGIVFGQDVMKNLVSQLVSLPGQIFKVGVSVVSNLIATVASLVFAFYLLLAREKLGEQLATFFGEEKSKQIEKTITQLESRLGGWARGELLLMLLVGVAVFIGLRLLGIPYALPLAILAGLMEIVPSLGPTISAIPVIIIGLGISPVMGLASAVLIFLVHQLENYLFVPKVMQKSAGVSPIATLFSLAVGAKLAGIVGLLISVPVLITLQVLLKDYLSRK